MRSPFTGHASQGMLRALDDTYGGLTVILTHIKSGVSQVDHPDLVALSGACGLQSCMCDEERTGGYKCLCLLMAFLPYPIKAM